jgi:hypothetical protein
MTKLTCIAVLISMLSSAGRLASQPSADHLSASSELSGVWEFRLSPECTEAETTVGMLSLSEAPEPLNDAWMNMSPATHVGVFTADLRLIGIDTEYMHPIVAARLMNADSVRIALNPGPSHGSVVMLGRLMDGTITGRWYETAYAPSKRGCFSLWRVSTRVDWARIARYYHRIQGEGVPE